MFILTDLPGHRTEGVDCRVSPLQVKPRLADPPREIGEYLTELVPEPEILCAMTLESDMNFGSWSGLLLVDQARESQYDGLLLAQRRRGRVPGPVAAVALTGDGFHGNRQRPWQAAAGNLHLSCQLPVDLDLVRCAPAVPAIAALSVCEAIAELAPSARPRIKWVNDVLLGPDKVAGVLASAQSRGDRLTCLTYGVGLNVTVAPEVPPTLFVPGVTSLSRAGVDAPLGNVLSTVLRVLSEHLETLQSDGPGRALEGYRRHCGDLGRRVAVYAEGLPDTDDPDRLPAPVAEGVVTGLDDQLALCIEGELPLNGGRLRYLDH